MNDEIAQEMQLLKEKMAALYQRIADAEEKMIELLQEPRKHHEFE